MNGKETSKDIIAEMRDLAEHRDWHNHTSRSNRERVSDLADRLEAAYKRDRAAIEADALAVGGMVEASRKRERGNCAKLREALSKSCTYFAVVLNTGMFNRVHLEALLNMAKAALAKPPRNCDMYATAEEAYQARLDDTENWDEFGSPKLKLHEWLFAPATKKKGGNDADE